MTHPKETIPSNGKAPAESMAKGLETMIDANRRGLDAACDANLHAFKRMVALNDEVFGFMRKRIEENSLTARKLAGCTSPPQVAAVCSQAFETAVEQYSAEMGKLAGIGVDQAREAMEDVQHEVEEAIEPLVHEN